MTTDQLKQLGKANYETYCETRDWKAYDGAPLPTWEQVKSEIQHGWIMAAGVVANLALAIGSDLPPGRKGSSDPKLN
jgi:hypothetical protein